MKGLDVLIVDDEEAARDVLSSLIQRSNIQVDTMRSCSNLPDAVEEIKKSTPDVAFLDINMPDYAGYEIGDFFDEIPCELIFVTAYDKYAIKAFELSAVDYLVKPVERSRLQESLEKLVARIEQKQAQSNYRVLLESMRSKQLDRIVVSELNDGQIMKHILPLEEIVALEANGAYTTIFMIGGTTVLVSKNIKQMYAQLPDDSFFMRTHRSWILNLNFISSYSPSTGEVTLTNGITAKVSKASKEVFLDKTSISL